MRSSSSTTRRRSIFGLDAIRSGNGSGWEAATERTRPRLLASLEACASRRRQRRRAMRSIVRTRSKVLFFMHYVVRTTGDPLAAVPAIRAAVRAFDPTVPVAEIQSMGELYSASTATPRTIALLLLAFAGVGLALGAVGIYGVISYAVTQRTRELGIRVALGAIQGRIVSMVVGEGIRMAGIGIVFGAVAAVVAARSLRTLVFGVATTDIATYGVVAAVLTVVALAASYIPARRASRVDPLIALRSD